ncbi:hypothetical protein OEIGOIKO_05803 [Streptomyces chrestomyceticus JCM 4735]|uniref:Uncharacterized protein n=1 Tax=Streptomyces chrestomyceticus JCM 4735 TaxID=1306181 RepID=A0A7U9L063_9ACTN|nr:hypothetical protein [Streptomyces chrestomyceticus]GCD37993.1 hypothetical protein OEIGOIKO_05803 [Streptomyces chrestomyceticus JCM 4735]
MNGEVRRYIIPEPRPQVWVKMPSNGGTLRGRVAALEKRPRAGCWVQVDLPAWDRWSTQLQPGQPSEQGIGPGTIQMWAPGYAVSSEEGVVATLERRIRCGEIAPE